MTKLGDLFKLAPQDGDTQFSSDSSSSSSSTSSTISSSTDEVTAKEVFELIKDSQDVFDCYKILFQEIIKPSNNRWRSGYNNLKYISTSVVKPVANHDTDTLSFTYIVTDESYIEYWKRSVDQFIELKGTYQPIKGELLKLKEILDGQFDRQTFDDKLDSLQSAVQLRSRLKRSYVVLDNVIEEKKEAIKLKELIARLVEQTNELLELVRFQHSATDQRFEIFILESWQQIKNSRKDIQDISSTQTRSSNTSNKFQTQDTFFRPFLIIGEYKFGDFLVSSNEKKYRITLVNQSVYTWMFKPTEDSRRTLTVENNKYDLENKKINNDELSIKEFSSKISELYAGLTNIGRFEWYPAYGASKVDATNTDLKLIPHLYWKTTPNSSRGREDNITADLYSWHHDSVAYPLLGELLGLYRTNKTMSIAENSLFKSVNLPWIGPVQSSLSSSDPMQVGGETSEKLEDYFKISYFRKLKNGKILKKADAKNKPTNGNNEVLMNLPVLVQKDQTILSTFNSNKSNSMLAGRAKRKRRSANTVMGKSAKQFAAETLQGNVLKSWQKMKDAGQKSFPTDQEWCHLIGHGDGGTEDEGNFVCGSFHCNTEQLAIESGLRKTTHTQKSGKYQLVVTAYLFSDNAPAAFIRYKIFEKSTLVFDYLFEGQSEFFDKNQYNLIEHFTRFTLKEQEDSNYFNEWYHKKKEEVLTDLLTVIQQLNRHSWSDSEDVKKKLKPFKNWFDIEDLRPNEVHTIVIIHNIVTTLLGGPITNLKFQSSNSPSSEVKRRV